MEKLDANYGDGCGALKERPKLNTIIEQGEQQQQSAENAATTTTCTTRTTSGENNNDNFLEEDKSDSTDENEDENEDEENNSYHWDVSKFVVKHSSEDRVAIFGGGPSRRRQTVEEKLKPYKSLNQYGTPRYLGDGDRHNLIRQINANKSDVVHIWTRF